MSNKKVLICLFSILVIISPLEILIGGEPHDATNNIEIVGNNQ